jgi:hypothetical protein
MPKRSSPMMMGSTAIFTLGRLAEDVDVDQIFHNASVDSYSVRSDQA